MSVLPDGIDDEFIKTWHPQYDKTEADEPEYRRLVAKVSVELGDLHSLTRQTFTDILDWKASRVKGRVDWTRFDAYSDAIRNCREASAIENMNALAALPGIGPPVASTFLHFMYPSSFPIFDVRTAEVLKHFSYIQHTSGDIKWYPAFMAAALALRDQYPAWSLREIDRAMFAFHKQNEALFEPLSKPRTRHNQRKGKPHHQASTSQNKSAKSAKTWLRELLSAIWRFMSRRATQRAAATFDGNAGHAKQQQANANAQRHASASQKKNGKSAKAWLRELLSVDGTEYTIDELAKRTGKTEVNIRTMLSDLRSAKYCGSGGVFNTKSVRKDGKVYYSKV